MKVQRCICLILSLVSALGYTGESLLVASVRELSPPFTTMFYVASTQLICVLLVVVIMRESFSYVSPRHYLIVSSIGFILALSHVAQVLAITYIGPGNATLLFYTEPIFATLFSVLLLGHTFRITDVLFATMSFAAVGIISAPLLLQKLSLQVPGLMLALFGGMASAAAVVIAKRLDGDRDSAGINILMIPISSSIIYFLVSIFFCSVFQKWTFPENESFFWLGPLAGMSKFVGVFLKYLATIEVKPSTVSVILVIEVFFTYIGDVLLFGYPLHWTIYVAPAVMACAITGFILTHKDVETNEGVDDDEENWELRGMGADE